MQLHDELSGLRPDFAPNLSPQNSKPPIFRIMVLAIDEPESVQRQLGRGQQVLAHNQEVKHTGSGPFARWRQHQILL